MTYYYKPFLDKEIAALLLLLAIEELLEMEGPATKELFPVNFLDNLITCSYTSQ
jgi:hypothetical protein